MNGRQLAATVHFIAGTFPTLVRNTKGVPLVHLLVYGAGNFGDSFEGVEWLRNDDDLA